MIRFETISKRYGADTVVRGVDLEVERGSTTVLIGPSGCGKSTLLRLVIGLITPDEGAVRFDGEVVGRDSIASVRRRTGYVIQGGGLFPHLTARANTVLMARHLRWAPERIAARLAELRALTKLPEEALDRYPRQLSGGQQQRVALMRALMLDPDVLLLDEPLGALDPMIRSELQDDLRSIFRTLGKTVLMVTHDLAEAAHFGDVVVLMRDGEAVQCGSVSELLSAPADEFVERFVSAQRTHLFDAGSEARQ